jgi:hypothetical protein
MQLHRSRRIGRFTEWIGAVLSLVVLATAAGAIQPAGSPAADLLLPQGPEAINRTLNAGEGALSGPARIALDRTLRDFALSTGAHWYAVAWNPVTGTPRLVTGSGLSLGQEIPDADTAERLARSFVERSHALWRLTPADLTRTRVAHGLGKWSVHFTQVIGGRPVIGSRLTVALTEAGRLAAFGGDLWPELPAPSAVVLSEDDAGARAWQAIHQRGRAPASPGPADRVWSEVLGVLPSGADAGYLVYRVRLAVREPAGAWMLDVDAVDGTIRQVQDVLRTADCFGTATGEIEDPGWCFGSAPLPAGLLEIDLAGVGTVTTGPDGAFLLPYGGTDPVAVSADLRGPYVQVNNTQNPDAHFEGTLVPGEAFALHWDDGNSRMDERDVFHHTNLAHQFIKWIDPSWSDLDFPMPANVNLQQTCNAYWDGSSINFFHEGGNCANTGRLGDVVHHEYCHGISDYMYGPNDPTGDMGEANSDVIGNYLVDDSKIGRGFYVSDCENGIRDSDNDLVWPDDLQGEVHWDGQILAGFHWDARVNLIAAYGPEQGHAAASAIWHFARLLGLPQTQPEQVWWSFLADDDDGILDNGTPHHAELWPAAAHHQFPYPEAFEDVVIHHTPLLYAPALPGQPIEVRAVLYSFAGALNPDSLLVYYRPSGDPEFLPVVMTPTGETDTYHGLVPNFPVGSQLDYYVFAADLERNHLTEPRTAPAEFYQAEVVSVYDPFEAASGWTVGAPGDNATQGIWERCDPIGVNGPGTGVPIQPENDTTPGAGALCWITGQYTGGYSTNSDANGRTTLLSPVYDLAGATQAMVRCRVWFQSYGGDPGARIDVQVSDSGLFWTTIYHKEGLDWTPTWEQMDVDVTPLFPTLTTLRLRVVMVGIGSQSIDEGGIDDLIIVAGEGSSAAPEPGPAVVPALRLALASGNPLLGADPARVRFELPRAADVRLRVLDPSGRVVRTLVASRRDAGAHQILWDRRDDAGRPVGSGFYLLRLVTPEGARTQRLVLAR